ncbi:HrgA protein [Klebsiella michiganensis]|uniref:HrgA protein n=1 Tax=Klebsiella michiganensis TaxID=1134687 RepID=UPI0032DA4401
MNTIEEIVSESINKPTLTGKVISILKEQPETQFTARELAGEICKRYELYAKNKMKSSTQLMDEEHLINQVAAEIGSQKTQLLKKSEHIKTTAGKPRKYYWVSKIKSNEQLSHHIVSVNSIDANSDHLSYASEYDLYPLLSDYASSTLGVYTRRIDEKRSKKGPFKSNKWVHPDLVGIQDKGAHWVELTKGIVSGFGGKRSFLWSFEVKVTLSISNVREAFFQTVSNSSWSHYGYLVAANIDDNCITELSVLNAAHGIGVILLDVVNPAESQILIPAKERAEIDWETCNRLISLNPDFEKYMLLIRDFLGVGTGNVQHYEWGVSVEK